MRDMMHQTGMGRNNIVARFTDIRNRIGQDAVLTYTQQHYNHRYGSSGGRHDLGGYEILTEYTRQVTVASANSVINRPEDSVTVRDDAPTSITHNLPYQVARNFMQGPVTRLRH